MVSSVFFAIPRRIRVYFRFNCAWPRDLDRADWNPFVEVRCRELGRDDMLPGERFFREIFTVRKKNAFAAALIVVNVRNWRRRQHR